METNTVVKLVTWPLPVLAAQTSMRKLLVISLLEPVFPNTPLSNKGEDEW